MATVIWDFFVAASSIVVGGTCCFSVSYLVIRFFCMRIVREFSSSWLWNENNLQLAIGIRGGEFCQLPVNIRVVFSYPSARDYLPDGCCSCLLRNWSHPMVGYYYHSKFLAHLHFRCLFQHPHWPCTWTSGAKFCFQVEPRCPHSIVQMGWEYQSGIGEEIGQNGN